MVKSIIFFSSCEHFSFHYFTGATEDEEARGARGTRIILALIYFMHYYYYYYTTTIKEG